MEKETWKEVEGYANYQVSNLGNVRNTKFHGIVGKIKEIAKSKNTNYVQCNLWKDGKMKTHFVHGLVATAFIDNPENHPCVNHKDEDKHNNNVENLEWCTIAYNNSYGTHVERAAETQRGRKCSEEAKAKMSIVQKKRFKTKENHPMFGKKHTEEARKKMVEANKRRLGGINNG